MRISDWSSDVCSSDLLLGQRQGPVSGPKKQGSDMSKRENSKHKIDRRPGLNLWGRSKSPINKREYGPGQHGQRRKKPTDLGIQLMAKPKLKGYSGNNGRKQLHTN